LRTPFNEQDATISPDGKWIAYASDESGRFEIYVDAFPVARNKFKVTDRGALRAIWRKDGRELAIISADGRSIFVSDIRPGAEFHATPPRQLIALPSGTVYAQPTPDFQRVLASVAESGNATSTLTLVFDWLGALKK
jgi:Tol biopolymer transport system component